MYYLNSRYYTPEWRRFINADEIIGETGTLLSHNMFAYCMNNPVNMDDPSGYMPNWLKVTIGAVAVVAAVTITVATGGAAAPLLIGVVVSTGIGAGVGYATGGVQGMIDGAADGFMWGGIGALGTSVMSAVPKIANVVKAAKNDPINKALKQLNSSGLRPGQTQVSRSKIMKIVENYDPIKAESHIYSNGGTRYLVEGHHTTIASTILGRGTGVNMGQTTSLLPSATNVYWTRRWFQLWKTTIKVID